MSSTRYEPIGSKLFMENRGKLISHLLPNALVVVNSNDLLPTNADEHHPFVQNSDLFYLTGIEQEESILLLCPAAREPHHRSMLFLRKPSDQIALWEGAKHTAESAQVCSGITEVHSLEDFPAIFHKLMAQVEHVYLNNNEHPRAHVEVESRDARFIAYCKARYPLHKYQRLAPIMAYLRAVKSPIELALIRRACEITAKGFCELLPKVQPGVMEYELEASLINTFICERSNGFAYTPIIASGKNNCVLHYIANNAACQAGDLVLIDAAASYARYCSDLTRVVPVSGRFSKRQKAVYQAVKHTLEQAKKLLKAGTYLPSYQEQVGKLIEEELLKLGILSLQEVKMQKPDKPAYKKYFMHGASHHLGLNTHDLADPYRKLEANMVLTVEPGIYLPEEGFGIRLENNVVITENGVEDLMAGVPLEADEIEELMHKQ